MSARAKLWSAGVLICLAALSAAAFLLPQSFRLTAFSDMVQSLLLASSMLAFLTRSLKAKGRMRLFWGLMTLGIALWLSYQLLWTYYEVFLRQDVPDLFSGDIVLFLHLVPLIAALTLRPHVPRDEYTARLGTWDFALLFIWWVYLYVLLVAAWQYASPDQVQYNHNLNAVYLAEKLVFLAALAACWAGSKGRWRAFYGTFFAASFTYAAGSYMANWAISTNVYYSGSLYDVPLTAAMASMTLIGLWTRTDEAEIGNAKISTFYGVWIARCGMIAAFSLPLFGAWALSDTAVPPPVRSFRIVLTLGAALAMGVMVFVRQGLLDRELMRLLQHSRESFENLKRLQAQIVQTEKMASIAQLVGGAAHELNNPITAMLGYSDLLLGTDLSPEQHTLAVKISQQVRKTKSLVASLLSFAKRAPAAKSAVDLNTLARTAVKLMQPQWQTLKIEVCAALDPSLPKVLGDSNQLLQVCLQILGNALRAADEHGGRKLILTTEITAGFCVLNVSESPNAGDRARSDSGTQTAADVTSSDPMDTLGLTACRGIVQEHQGRISLQRRPDGSSAVRIELPGISPSSENASGATVPVLWQSQPFA